MNEKSRTQQANDATEKKGAVQDVDLDALDEVIGGSNPFADVPRTNLNPLDDKVRTNG